jgi:hypothetical protein
MIASQHKTCFEDGLTHKMEKWTFKHNIATGVLEFALVGMWKPEDGAAWLKAFKAKTDEVTNFGNRPYKCLVDMTKYPTQTAAIAEFHKQCMVYGASKGLTKSAHVVADVITKMQHDRLSKPVEGVEFANFSDRVQAEAWLRKA